MRTTLLPTLVLAVAFGPLKAGEVQPVPLYPPPEAQGGWPALVPANREPAAEQKRRLREEARVDWDRLAEAWRYCQGFGAPNSLLVIRRGRVVGEWYDYTNPRGIASCTKSLTALAMAKLFDLSDAGLLKQKVGIDDEAWRHLPAHWAEAEPARKKILLRHLLTMTSGLTPYDGPYPRDKAYEDIVFAQGVEAEPGKVWAYASVPVDLLALIVERVAGVTQEQFFHDQLLAKIDGESMSWGEYNGHTGGSGGPRGGARFTARALARVGYLVLRDGAWVKDGKKEQVIGTQRIRQFTRPEPALTALTWRQPNFAWEPHGNRFYSHLWWNNSTRQGLGNAVPRDAVYMSGWGKQICLVIPSLDLVVVRLGSNRKMNERPEFYHELGKRVMASLTDVAAEEKKEAPEKPPGVARVERWDTWETALTSKQVYANPFRDVTLTATFTHPETRRQITVDGFHDGGNTWRLRFLPLELGNWLYITRSNDPDLDARRGQIQCVEPRQPYLHGPVRAEGLHFRHADGTRRYLVSTRLSSQFARPEVRQRVLAYLQEARINRVLFMMGGVSGTIKDLYGPGPDFDRYNVRQFQAIDTFIDELRRHDILAAPYFYYFNDRVQCGMTLDQDRAFVRYGMARMGAYANVLPVLANEVEQKHTRRKDKGYNLESYRWANEVGKYLKGRAVFGQAVTVHSPMETDVAVNPGFYTLLRDWPFPWADLMLRQAQVGSLGALPELRDDVPENRIPTFNERAYARHNQILIDLRRFGVPVINEEPGYEMNGMSWDGKKRTPLPWNSQTADSFRATLWTAAAAGAYVMWGNPATYVLDDPLPKMKEAPETPRALRAFAEVMNGIPYGEMLPANDLVSANGVEIDKVSYRTNFASARRGRCYLVYSLRGGEVELQMEKGTYAVTVLDPRTGERKDLGKIQGDRWGGVLPRGRDAVVLLQEARP